MGRDEIVGGGASHLCPLCGQPADPRVLNRAHELRPPVLEVIRQETRGWKPGHGICPACAMAYAAIFAQQRSTESLHTTTDPHGTFPYYHPQEETVLAQPERLPDYEGMDGTGVTIAFLDSGYFPHPDFSLEPGWSPQLDWATLRPREWQRVLQRKATRLVGYVDLANDHYQVGLASASLWDSAADSWHGEMTSAIAAGNGALSQGHFRGFAPGANLLPLKIGRGNGRIPESDILAGLQWLLQGDRWVEYRVRVLNVSVGGDLAQSWRENPVCLVAEELARRGLFVAAAAGNSGQRRLLAPAQAPSVLTVGGVDDGNRHWRADQADDLAKVELYHHNYGKSSIHDTCLVKPEIVALAQWLPAPVLPVSPVFREMAAIAKLRRTLREGNRSAQERLIQHWVRTLSIDPEFPVPPVDSEEQVGLERIWHALRKRMNAHKWVHACYQHVDGTSVAVAQVSAVAAQMLQANPSLTPARVRRLLQKSALFLPHLPRSKQGHGLLNPATAVASALRAPGGLLSGLPHSGTVINGQRQLHDNLHGLPVIDLRAAQPAAITPGAELGTRSGNGLRTQPNGGTVATRRSADRSGSVVGAEGQFLYLGLLVENAVAVSVLGSFNRWQPEEIKLHPTRNGWWHTMLLLPPGEHVYRFWVQDDEQREGTWRLDPENPLRVESGYLGQHSLLHLTDG